jgi:threonine dehydrogenase-like Zn-dependent dehydrogenase
MKQKSPKRIGLAIVGAGCGGLMRGEIAARFPQVDWIGIAEIDPARGKLVAEKIGADFVTTDYRELLKRQEDPAPNSPMVISGTHALDIVMWRNNITYCFYCVFTLLPPAARPAPACANKARGRSTRPLRRS